MPCQKYNNQNLQNPHRVQRSKTAPFWQETFSAPVASPDLKIRVGNFVSYIHICIYLFARSKVCFSGDRSRDRKRLPWPYICRANFRTRCFVGWQVPERLAITQLARIAQQQKANVANWGNFLTNFFSQTNSSDF